MDDVTRSSGLRIGLSLSIAFLFHTILAIILVKWSLPEPEETISTLNVQLRQVIPVEVTKTPPPSQSTVSRKPEKELVTTTSDNDFTQLKETPTQQMQSRPTPQPSIIKPPKFNTIGDRPSPSAESGDAFRQFNQLFIQKKDLNQQTEQISTKKAAIITPYMEKLIQKLSESQNHDRQYQLSALKVARSLIIELNLLANGALENVRILKESGDPKLDKAAMRAAFLASPFPPPPVEDLDNGYVYEFELIYTPRENLDQFKK